MGKLQFTSLLGPAVASFVLVLLAWMQSNSRMTDLKENMVQRFADSDRKLSDLRAEMNGRFESVDQQFNGVNRQFDRIDRQFDSMGQRMERLENDQKQFFTVTGKLDGRIDEIARR